MDVSAEGNADRRLRRAYNVPMVEPTAPTDLPAEKHRSASQDFLPAPIRLPKLEGFATVAAFLGALRRKEAWLPRRDLYWLFVMPAADKGEACRAGERIRSGVADAPFSIAGVPDARVTLSGGVAVRRPGESIPDWVTRADRRLYAAKAAGRDRIVSAGNSERA